MTTVMLTSGFDFKGYDILEYVGFCSGECVLGTGFLSSLEAGLSDFLGMSSTLYKDKLSKAKEIAIEDLKQQALNRGANAIIGLDVDYTMFSSDIIGVIASGTAVRIERFGNSSIENVHNIFVNSYNPDNPFRILSVGVREGGYIQVTFVPLGNAKISAFDLDISFLSIFEDSLLFKGVRYMNVSQSAEYSYTEACRVAFPSDLYKQFKSAFVHVRKYIQDGKVVTCDTTDKKIQIPESNLHGLRKLYGLDMVSMYEEHDDVWTCLCGKENDDTSLQCTVCGRQKKSMMVQTVGELYAVLVKQLKQLDSAREIWAYITAYNEERNGVLPEKLLTLVNESVSLERLYGNQKDSCIRKIEEHLHT